MKKLVFYKCEICGNVAIKLVDSGVPMFCCGMPMSKSNQGHCWRSFTSYDC